MTYEEMTQSRAEVLRIAKERTALRKKGDVIAKGVKEQVQKDVLGAWNGITPSYGAFRGVIKSGFYLPDTTNSNLRVNFTVCLTAKGWALDGLAYHTHRVEPSPDERFSFRGHDLKGVVTQVKDYVTALHVVKS